MNRKIKNILIEPRFQIQLMSYFVGLFIFTVASLYFVNFYFFWTLKEKATSVGIPPQHVFFTYLTDQKSILDTLFFILTFFNLVVLAVVGFFISHRVAGPIYKLKNYLKGIHQDSPEFKLRKDDFLKELEPIINDLKGRMK